jgi:hypothetical protein
MKPASHLFQADLATATALSREEVVATCEALEELDLYRLPYPRVDVRIPADAILRVTNGASFGPEGLITMKGLSLEPNAPRPTLLFTWASNKRWHGHDFTDLMPPDMPADLCDFLITLLATRNAVKTTKHHKSAKLGIGKSPYEYVTTISLPQDLEDDEDHKPTGKTVCAHLRRGHIRRQHYGPAREYVKRIWIAPIFVNADKDYVATRTAYNISLSKIPSMEKQR